MSCITLVGKTFVNFCSAVGCRLTGVENDKSFCNFAIEQDDFFEVCDITKDERHENGIDTTFKYYGAYPLKSPKGYNFGNLVVCDSNPKKLDETQKLALKTLAKQIMVKLELRKQNIKLSEALERAEKLSKVKDFFVSNMSHELRTPMNAINGFVEILSKSSLNSDQKEVVSIIQSSCDILITLTNDILDISKIESGKLSIDKLPFDFRQEIKNIRDLLNKKAQEKNIELNLIIDEKIPKTIVGDKVRINQIIMNLIGNSIKFTSKGSVKLEVNLKEEYKSQVSLDFSIMDTGIGIPEDRLEAIFDRFEQCGQETSKKYGGTGLGLSISKNLVELHQGKLNVRSVFGEGTEFYFNIIYDKLNEEETLKKNLKVFNYSNFNNLKNLKILICENNAVHIILIKHLFKNKITSMEIAENGKVAIEILKSKKVFDVILMDIHMPEMNGIETTKYIRETLKLTLPIIGFTANSSESEKELCLRIGMNDYITKTFKSEEFYQSLSLAMKRKKVYQEDPLEQINILRPRSYSSKMLKFNNEDEYTEIKKLVKKYSDKIVSKTSHFINVINCITSNSQRKIKNGCKDKANKFISDTIITKENLNELGEIDFLNNIHIIANPSGNCLVNQELEIIKNLKVISEDDEEFEKEFMLLFLKEFPKEIDNLGSAINLDNIESIKFTVNKMKSSLTMIGFNNLKEKIINLEKKYYYEDKDTIIKMYFDIKEDVESIFLLLNNYSAKLL